MSSFGTIQVDRGLVWGYSEVEMLQLNAPVIRGSNGAAVVNSEGRVVGMIAGMLDDPAAREDNSKLGGLAGYIVNNRVVASPVNTVSFAIPIEKAREIAAELKQHGRVDRGFLGIAVQRGEAAEGGQNGVRVREVMPGGPAALAGILPGDLILAYAGQSVSIGDQITFLVSATRPGSRVPVRIQRKGTTGETEVVVGTAPNRYTFSAISPSFPEGVPEASRMPDQKSVSGEGPRKP
jgi:S1-C subfamily serine protease